MDSIQLILVSIFAIILSAVSITIIVIYWWDRNYAVAMTFLQLAVIIIASTWGPNLILAVEFVVSGVSTNLKTGARIDIPFTQSLFGLLICGVFALVAMIVRQFEIWNRTFVELEKSKRTFR